MARTQYLQELESVRQNLIEMGETTIALLTEAIRAVSGAEDGSAERASELEAKTDHQMRTIHDQCLSLITLQAPVARDARLVTGVLDAIVDLELIGDYAYEMVTLSGSTDHRPPHLITNQLSETGSGALEILSKAIDGWRSEEAAQGLSVGPQAVVVRAECETLYGKLAQLASAPGDAPHALRQCHAHLPAHRAYFPACRLCCRAGGGHGFGEFALTMPILDFLLRLGAALLMGACVRLHGSRQLARRGPDCFVRGVGNRLSWRRRDLQRLRQRPWLEHGRNDLVFSRYRSHFGAWKSSSRPDSHRSRFADEQASGEEQEVTCCAARILRAPPR